MGAITAGLGSCDAGAERLFTATLTGRGGGGRRAAGRRLGAAGPAHTGASDGKGVRREDRAELVRGERSRAGPSHPPAPPCLEKSQQLSEHQHRL